METVKLKINNIDVEAPAGSTILEAAHLANIKIPTLCFLKDINEIGACRICVCEVKGGRALVAACVYPVTDGMEVFTNTPKIRKARKTTLELISEQPQNGLSFMRAFHKLRIAGTLPRIRRGYVQIRQQNHRTRH